MQFIEYPKCTTCQKAKKWLIENNINYEDRNIITNNPTKEELSRWIKDFNIPIKKLFNTSGLKYKELKLKDKRKLMTTEEQLSLLATDGMLIKRPILVGENFILIGFKEKEWMEILCMN